jgi:hypothetical protein
MKRWKDEKMKRRNYRNMMHEKKRNEKKRKGKRTQK